MFIFNIEMEKYTYVWFPILHVTLTYLVLNLFNEVTKLLTTCIHKITEE
jgi:hypothetical protein